MPRGINTIPHIFSRTIRDEESGCLLFTGALDRDGYPRISLQGKMHFGSHILYQWRYGSIPEGCEIDHRCYNRRCLEPTHLRALSHRENVLHSKTYDEKRHRRLRTFIDAYPQVTSFPVVLTLPELQPLWECTCTGNVKKLLRTMSSAFPEEFCYERFAAGQGRNPDLYAIGIQPSLIDKLSNEDERRETPAEDIMTLVA
jgi:hypothetical protein